MRLMHWLPNDRSDENCLLAPNVDADVAEVVDGVDPVVLLGSSRSSSRTSEWSGYQPKLFFGNSSKPSACVTSAPNVTRFVNHEIGA